MGHRLRLPAAEQARQQSHPEIVSVRKYSLLSFGTVDSFTLLQWLDPIIRLM